MPLFDYQCPFCKRIEPDVLVRSGHAVEVECLDCCASMYRRLGVPQPAIVTHGGTGASRGA